jgi:hypothetical protein
MEPKLGLGKARGLGLFLTLSMSNLTTRFPRRPVGPTREGPTMVGLYSRVGRGCGGRGVGGRSSRQRAGTDRRRWYPSMCVLSQGSNQELEEQAQRSLA